MKKERTGALPPVELVVRLTQREADAMIAAAKAEGVPLNTWARGTINREAKKWKAAQAARKLSDATLARVMRKKQPGKFLGLDRNCKEVYRAEPKRAERAHQFREAGGKVKPMVVTVPSRCFRCNGSGQTCQTCGEAEGACSCGEDQNMGECPDCKGTGK